MGFYHSLSLASSYLLARISYLLDYSASALVGDTPCLLIVVEAAAEMT